MLGNLALVQQEKTALETQLDTTASREDVDVAMEILTVQLETSARRANAS